MQLYKVVLTPKSRFSTRLKGDTLFGHLCWAIVYLQGRERLVTLLKEYDRKPFAVVSDAFPSGYLPKPTMPSIFLGEKSDEKKENRKKIWIKPRDFRDGMFTKAVTEKDAGIQDHSDSVIHNSINYRNSRTDDSGVFAPYGEVEYSFGERDIYVLLDETKMSKDEIVELITLIGESGYGRDASIGKGRFEIQSVEPSDLQDEGRYFMALSPFTPEGTDARELYYEPFTRFGRFGGDRARKNAFKKPLLLADTGSVLFYESPYNPVYVGKSIRGVSERYPDAVHQGYSIVLPFKEKS